MSKAQKWGLTGGIALHSFDALCEKSDHTLYPTVIPNPLHVLYPLLPPLKTHQRNLHNRAHNRQLPPVSSMGKRNFSRTATEY